METKENILRQTIIHNVRKADLPASWLKHLNLEVAPDQLLDITITPVFGVAEQRNTLAKPSQAELDKLIERYQNRALLNPHFTEDDLYDDQGLSA